MTMQQTYGPVECTLDPEDSTIGGTPVSSDRESYWLDEYGWCFAETSSVTGAGLSPSLTCQLDGIWILRSNIPSAFGVADLNYDYLTNKLITISGGNLTLWAPDTGNLQRGVLRTSTEVRQIRTPFGWYRQTGPNIQRAPLDATSDADYVTVYTPAATPTFGGGSTVSPGPDNTIFFCYDDTAGTILQYDMVANTEVPVNPSNPTGSSNRIKTGVSMKRCCYSPKFDCFMVLTTNAISGAHEVNIFSRELAPSALSAPVASPAITAGAVSEISVTLTDDNGVGIAGRLIDWSLTAGNGTLVDTQTETDEDGIATTQYRAPITGGVNPTIQASLTY